MTFMELFFTKINQKFWFRLIKKKHLFQEKKYYSFTLLFVLKRLEKYKKFKK
jgi:hypothetical protein